MKDASTSYICIETFRMSYLLRMDLLQRVQTSHTFHTEMESDGTNP